MSKLVTINGQLFIEQGDNAIAVIKGWESYSGWYWFATELEKKDYGGAPLWFGYVQGFHDEWGTFWQGELDPMIEQGKIWEIKPQDLPLAGRRN